MSAQSGGRSTFNFLNLSIPARVASLGGTLISVRDNDLNLSFQNPSLLDSSMHNQIALSYVNYLADIKYGYAAYSRTYKKVGSFSAGIQFLDYGAFTSATVTGETTGTFTASEYALNLGYGRSLDSVFSIGANFKTIYSKLSQYSSYGNALDFGGTYFNKKKMFSAALVLKNIGKQWKTYNVVHESLPFEIQLGLSKKLLKAPFRFNFTATHLEKWNLTFVDSSIALTDPISGLPIKKNNLSSFSNKLASHFIVGGEILLSKNFHLRIGYNYLRRQELKVETRPGIAGFSFGFGLKVSKFILSYGYMKYHLAGSPNFFTISTNLSDFYSKR